MQIQNQIISYFVDLSSPPKTFKPPVTMNSDVAYEIIKSECNSKLSGKKLMHVCYDIDSKIIYIPNACNFTNDQKITVLQSAKYHIVKEFNDFKYMPPIEGSPFSSLRIRSIKSFGYVWSSINSYFGEDIDNLTVVEANLVRMPTTVSKLPAIYKNNKNYSGGLISTGKEIAFIDEIDINGKRRQNPIQLITLKTPFILIDISPSVSTSLTEKEWAVLSGYRDYIDSTENTKSKVESFAPLFAAKRYMYLGWPFEEICEVLLECVKDFGSLMKGIDNLIEANNSLINEGYASLAKNYYYIVFKVDITKFPLKFDNNFKIPFFDIMGYDDKTQYIIIKTPAYINSNLCLKVLCAKSRPYILKYNHAINKIDVKVNDAIHKELQLRTDIPNKLRETIKKDNNIEGILDFRSDERSRSISLSSDSICHVRMISDYYLAKDYINKMCKKRNVDFEDIQVVVGPIEKIFGQGVQGGFMGKKQFEDSKLKIPYQIEKGLYINPPIIMVNSITMPSYAAQTEVLIHEYSHKIYSMQNPDHQHLYNKEKNLRHKDSKKYWELYLGDEDEKIAHQEEIRFELISGKSVDEIVRDKVGGAITKNNYKESYIIAINFKAIVDEVVKQIEEEK